MSHCGFGRYRWYFPHITVLRFPVDGLIVTILIVHYYYKLSFSASLKHLFEARQVKAALLLLPRKFLHTSQTSINVQYCTVQYLTQGHVAVMPIIYLPNRVVYLAPPPKNLLSIVRSLSRPVCINIFPLSSSTVRIHCRM
jgi:hypothetical protein